MTDPNPTKLFQFRLSQSERSLWDRYCATHFDDVTPQAVARSMLMQIASDGLDEPNPDRAMGIKQSKDSEKRIELSLYQLYRTVKRMTTLEKKSDLPEREKHTVYLTPSESAAVKETAKLQNMTHSNLIGIAVRAMLRIESEPMPDELDDLRESNQQLHRVGSNLNQIARRLNRNSEDFSKEELAIDELEKDITGHLSKVSTYLSSVRHRWDLDRLF